MNVSLTASTIFLLAAATVAQTTVYSSSAPRATSSLIAGSNTGSPSYRYWGGSATDGTSLFVFGGRSTSSTGVAGSIYYNGLYAYDVANNVWSTLSVEGDATAPLTGFRQAMAFDPSNNRLVVYGGLGSPTGPYYSDCFAFDLTAGTWSQIPNPTPGTSGPDALFDATLAYDPATGSMLLFGGQGSTGATSRTNSTWLLSGTTWTQVTGLVTGTTVSSPRGTHAMATRTAPYNDVILVGGQDDLGAIQNDTWRWDGAAMQWSQITPVGNTVPVTIGGGNVMVYDSVRQVLSIILGTGTNVAPSTTTAAGSWTSEYDCVTNTWRAYGSNLVSQTANDPLLGKLQRFFCAFVNGKTYFWGGQNTVSGTAMNTVKQYQANPLATATSYGAGCSGPGGLLTLTANSDPWTTRTWSATGSNFGPVSLSMSAWGFAPTFLPLNPILPLAPIGCDLLNTADVLYGPSLPSGGQATETLLVPNNTALAGTQLHLQMIEFEFGPTFDLLGIYTSNGVTISIGAL